ncbi:MAG: serine hydrolase [Clostridia bacterium]|nr:serine hydrolase [Clostridia bacterium]
MQRMTSPSYRSLGTSLQQEVEAVGGRWGIYFEDLATGAAVGLGADEPFVAASTTKVPLVLYLYTRAWLGEIDLRERLRILSEDMAPGTGILQTEGPGGAYTLAELAELALRESDNVAANALFRRLSRPAVYDFMAGLGARVVPTGPGPDNLTSARDMATFFKFILRLRRSWPEGGQAILEALAQSPFTDRIVRGVPPNIPVAHKIGSEDTVRHDAGIVFLPGRPYVLIVLSEHDEPDRAAEAIGRLSSLVYRVQAARPRFQPDPEPFRLKAPDPGARQAPP